MVACARPKCRRELHESWSFCPYCGQDCRPPAERKVAVRICDHQFFGEGAYCVICGYSQIEGGFIERAGDSGKRKLAIGFLIGGFALFALSLFLMWLIEGAYGPAQVIVDQVEAGKTIADPIAKKRGTSVMSPILAIAGFISLALGGYFWNLSRAKPIED